MDTRESYFITPQDLSRFLLAKGVLLSCPACHTHDAWQNYCSEHGITSIPVYREGDAVLGGGAVEVIMLRCDHCGHIRLFDLSVFSHWRQLDVNS